MTVNAPSPHIDGVVPWLIIGAAAAHTAVAVAASPAWDAIAAGGVWNTVANDDYPAMTTLWFSASGVALLGVGLLSRRIVRSTGTLAPEIGWILLAIGVPVSVLEPLSGGWLLTGIGLLALVGRRRRLAVPHAQIRGVRRSSR